MVSEHVRQNSRKAIETLRTFLTTKVHLAPQEESRLEETIFQMNMEGPTPKVVARILIDKERFIVHFYFTRTVPPELRAKVAEYIIRVNYGLIGGGLEMSFDNGTIRYKTGIDFTNIELAEQLVRNAMLSAIENIEQLVIPLWDVLDEDAEPEAAAAAAFPLQDVARFEP